MKALKGRFIEYDDLKTGESKECKEIIADMDLIIEIMSKDPIDLKTIKDKLNRDHKYYCSAIVDDFMNYNANNYLWITSLETANFYNEIYPDKLDLNVLYLNLCEGKFDISLCTFNESFLLIYKNHVDLLDKVKFLVSVYEIDVETINNEIRDYVCICLLLIPENRSDISYSMYEDLPDYKLPKAYVKQKMMNIENLKFLSSKKNVVHTPTKFIKEVDVLSVSKNEFFESVEISDKLDYFLSRSGMYETIINISRNKSKCLALGENYIKCVILLCNSMYNNYRYIHLFRHLGVQYKNVWLYESNAFKYIHPYILLEPDMKEAIIYNLIGGNLIDDFEANDLTKVDIEFIKSKLIYQELQFNMTASAIDKLIKEHPEVFDKGLFEFLKRNCMFNILNHLEKARIVEPN